jgi:hypothetical protein
VRDRIETRCPRCKQQNTVWRKACRVCGAALHVAAAQRPR